MIISLTVMLAFLTGGFRLWAQEGELKVYRIKRSGESSGPAKPVAVPERETTEEPPPPGGQDNSEPTGGVWVGPPAYQRERAKPYVWEHSQKKTLKRYDRDVKDTQYLNHDIFGNILKKFVNKHGWVDYRGLKRDKWAMNDLKAYVEDLSRIDPASLEDPMDRLAAWLNLYNSLVLFEIVKHYPVKNVMQIKDFFGGRRYKIGKKDYSLLDIEELVFKNEVREPRAVLGRVNGASDGPRLRKEAFQATKLEKQLDEQVFKFLTDPANVYYDPHTKVLTLNPTLLWYQEEIGDLAAFLGTYLDRLPAVFSVNYRGYDWKLNDEKLH